MVGSGNAALCAAISARRAGAHVCVFEAGGEADFGGNSRYTAGAMRFAFASPEELAALIEPEADSRIGRSDFGAYSEAQFLADLCRGQDGGAKPLQRSLVERSYGAVAWLSELGIAFDPIYERQAFERDGRFHFWGGVVLGARGEGEGLVAKLADIAAGAGVEIRLRAPVEALVVRDDAVAGVELAGGEVVAARAVVLACGGFEANAELRAAHLGAPWRQATVRGTPYNRGAALTMARAVGAATEGDFAACHAVCMDVSTPNFEDSPIPHIERRKFRKISYPFGVMLNAEGRRFVDEGADFRNYTYAQYGRAVLEQPGAFAWQIFDAKSLPLLYDDYAAEGATRTQAATLPALCAALSGVDGKRALDTLRAYNEAAGPTDRFDPTKKDGCATRGITPPKSNWALPLDSPPYTAFRVTCGITFTYGGLRVDPRGSVLRGDGTPVPGLFAAGEAVGGIFYSMYPGGSGLTSGAVFGRAAGEAAAAL